MDALGRIARRFPLVPRARPACRPLDERIREIADLARAAAEPTTNDRLATAATAQNKAALIASDCGMSDLAHTLSRQHAALYLRTRPLTARTARYALEPLINLARLRIRADAPDTACELLEDLYRAVRTRRSVLISGLKVPLDDLTLEESRDVHGWLWSVVLADGIRAFAGVGRWKDAVAHAERHRGVGHRLLDGRQAAVIAPALSGDRDTAFAMLEQATVSEEWEQAVEACLTLFCYHALSTTPRNADMATVTEYLDHEAKPELMTFRTRTALTTSDLCGDAGDQASRSITRRIIEEALATGDGYVARDLLRHSRCRMLLTESQEKHLSAVVTSAGLGRGHMPNKLYKALIGALKQSEHAIADALTDSSDGVFL
ncbi:hypothetical protein [Actinomadura algeriensis]|uniref:XRE family transcriptional regulator n=1 Tax=Actinomadura algeriensis TaxID=1679523 RepID=A0ABR9JRN8_9ACTN|nr:hypothetical protein [Actinomadura algeriensis]MBE1533240.1 hypothetical protein [Actinomadura algeriensis]